MARSIVCYLPRGSFISHCRAREGGVLTLLVGRQEGHPVYKKNLVAGCWRGYQSGARCRFAYGPADSTATHCLLLH